MSQLTETLVRNFEKDKQWILAMLSNVQSMKTSVKLLEEPGEIVITLLMKDNEIEEAVKQATQKTFGDGVTASDISLRESGRIIDLTFSCANS